MAEIDKTYTNSYEEYKDFKEWASKQTVVFFDGHKERIGDWVREWEEEDFDGTEIPIMNTPTWLDVYLIQNCKSRFVLDRMKEVYGEDSYREFKTVNLAAKPPIKFQQNRKIIIKRNKRTRFPLHEKPYEKTKWWWLQCDDDFWYNDETKRWVMDGAYYPTNTNTAHLTSIRAIVRHLRNQHLPKGIEFTISGSYVGEEYRVVIA